RLFERVIKVGVFAAEFTDVIEGSPMYGTRPKIANRALVIRRCISLMTGEPVAGVFRIQLSHQMVAIDFRDDRRGSNREIDPVTFIETVLRLGESGNSAAVDQDVLWRGWQGLSSPPRLPHVRGA